ncbi:hypothetical protein Y1Q_0014165 [Alligator mississippiensis]|uniref:Uncharacterized protein n=1 Tax=Alligator mississippiensis TaxID=8496 RepID=A0A151MTW9_ALLMI|nr:hypothetical protein Y1Q_0014165 [Alligator mississippiensis]
MEDDDIIPGDNLTKLLSPLGCFYGPKFWHQTVATHESRETHRFCSSAMSPLQAGRVPACKSLGESACTCTWLTGNLESSFCSVL